jgi:hypothetical protein
MEILAWFDVKELNTGAAESTDAFYILTVL